MLRVNRGRKEAWRDRDGHPAAEVALGTTPNRTGISMRSCRWVPALTVPHRLLYRLAFDRALRRAVLGVSSVPYSVGIAAAPAAPALPTGAAARSPSRRGSGVGWH